MKLKCRTLAAAISVLICLSHFSMAQESITPDTSNYSRSTYQVKDRLFATYLVNDFHKFNLNRPDSLGKAILDYSQESKKTLNKSKVFSSIGSILAFVGCLSTLNGPMMALREPDSHPIPGIMLVGGWSMVMISIPIKIKASNLKNQFIWTFNRDAMRFGKEDEQRE